MLKKTKKDFFNKIMIKDYKTVNAYKKRIKIWEDFVSEKVGKTDYIPKTVEDSVDIMQLFINWFFIESWNHMRKRKGHSPNSVCNYASSIRKYLYYRGSPLTKDDFQEYVELPKKLEKELHGLSINEIIKILGSLSYDDKVLFMCQLSSGMRIGEMVQLKKRHIITDKERLMIKIPAKIAKFRRARTTFFSNEAASLLKVILKRKEDDDLVFGTCEDVEDAESTKGNTLRKHLVKIGLGGRYEDTDNYLINTHSFRSYFITKVSRHDPNLAKFYAGEKGYLLQYDRLTDEEKLEHYIEFESDLLIYDQTKNEEKIRKLKDANSKINNQVKEMKEQENRIKQLEQTQKEQSNLLELMKKYTKITDI